MQRSFPSPWGILVNPCPELGTPGAPLDLALSVQQMLPSARLTASASTTTKDFGADFLTAPVLAVYASHPSGHPVEWQDSLPGCQLRLCPGWTFTNKIPSKGFLYSGLIPPFPSFAWRDNREFLQCFTGQTGGFSNAAMTLSRPRRFKTDYVRTSLSPLTGGEIAGTVEVCMLA